MAKLGNSRETFVRKQICFDDGFICAEGLSYFFLRGRMRPNFSFHK